MSLDVLKEAILAEEWRYFSHGNSHYILYPASMNPMLAGKLLRISKVHVDYNCSDLERRYSLKFNQEYRNLVVTRLLGEERLCYELFSRLPRSFFERLRDHLGLDQVSSDQTWAALTENTLEYFYKSYKYKLFGLQPLDVDNRSITIELKPKVIASYYSHCTKDIPCKFCYLKTQGCLSKNCNTSHCPGELYSKSSERISLYIKQLLKCSCSQLKVFHRNQQIPIKTSASSVLTNFFHESCDNHLEQIQGICNIMALILIKDNVLNVCKSLICDLLEYSRNISSETITKSLKEKLDKINIKDILNVITAVKNKQISTNYYYSLVAIMISASLNDISLMVSITPSSNLVSEGSSMEFNEVKSVFFRSREYRYIIKIIDTEMKPVSLIHKYINYQKHTI